MVVEVLGSPDAGKTASLALLSEQLNEEGVATAFIRETRGKNLFPKSQRGTLQYNINVGGITCQRIKDSIDACPEDTEIILVDKGIVDYKYFCHHYFLTGKANLSEVLNASVMYDDYEIMPDIVVILVCSPEMAALRCEDAPETKTVKVQQSIDSLRIFYRNWDKTPIFWLDTTLLSIEDTVEFLHSLV